MILRWLSVMAISCFRNRTVCGTVMAVTFAATLTFIVMSSSQSHHTTPTSTTGGSISLTTDEMSYMLYGDKTYATSKLGLSDIRYVNYVRSHIAVPSPTREVNLTDQSGRTDFSQYGQSRRIDHLLGARRGGFFVECGAVDGELYSNTLLFELQRNWTGLLVEANPHFYRQLLAKNRKAYVFGGCLSPYKEPRMVTFLAANVVGGTAEHYSSAHLKRASRERPNDPLIATFCVPLTDLLAAIGVSHVDVLTLDVEGAELKILETIDFRAVRIDVVMVEYQNGPRDFLHRLRHLLVTQTGLYRQVETIKGLDVIFARVDMKV